EPGTADSVTAQKVLDAAKELDKAGAQVKEVSFPYLKQAFSAYYTIAMAEASSNLARFDGIKYGFRAENFEDLNDLYCRSRSEGFGTEVKKRILLGTTILSGGYYDEYYLKAMKIREAAGRELDRIFTGTDLLLTPTAPGTAPHAGSGASYPVSVYYSDVFTVFANLAGLPSVSFPCGTGENGMPVGAQLTGRAADDGLVLNAAHAYQLRTDWHISGLSACQGDSPQNRVPEDTKVPDDRCISEK
ncbi:MAG: Asp-tRNA(Asn)/Glu-tRNA(Gln) amidotransferase subunit GatA, partial [Oscillospiraceae bacterium]|nr:Asp-tRNA(Asn)/Glu-tRNA(Gln) amidotransferase subunit GatA [Oscillospiraceae bacterium]